MITMSLLLNDETGQIQNMFRRDLSFSTNYELDESFRKYKDGQQKILKDNLELLNEIPLNEDFRKEIIEYFKKDIIESLNKDPMYEKSVEIGSYASNLSKKLHIYFKELFKFNEELKKKLNAELLHTSKIFLDSNLPISFLDSINESILAELDFIDVYTREISKERVSLIVNLKNRKKFERICKNHNSWAARFNEKRDRLEHNRLKLLWYADFNNSTEVDEIFKDKKLSIERLDQTILTDFIGNLVEQINEMEKLNSALMGFDDLVSSNINEPTKVLLNLIQTISK